MNSKERRRRERRLTHHFGPVADAIDELANGVERGEVSAKELRDIAAELRRSGLAARASDALKP